MRITADTNFFISATQWDNSVAHKLLIKLIKIDAKIFTTKEILNEFSEVLQRDFEYNETEVKEIMEKVLSFAVLVEPTVKVEVVKEDPDDDKIIECALASSSDYILSYNKHLLKIKEYQGVKIVKPEEFLGIIK